MTINYTGKPLYTIDSKSKVRVWYVKSDLIPNENNEIILEIVHGVFNGKLQSKFRVVSSGKNIGKSNETSLEEQAISEINSLYEKQFKLSYYENIEDFVVAKKPNLAYTLESKQHTLDFVNNLYYLSPKYDGIRCFIIVDDKGVASFYSRTLKKFIYFSRIISSILNLKNNSIYDGELYNPNLPFNIISSIVNKSTYVEIELEDEKVTTSDIKFYCYDWIDLKDESKTYVKRFEENEDILSNDAFIKVVNKPVKSLEEIIEYSKDLIALGFEGGMVRNGNAAYEFDTRTVNLLKVKFMLDTEFLILNIYPALNDPEKVMFTLENKFTQASGYNTFECVLKGSKKDNLKILEDKENYIKKRWLKVKYQTLSSYNVPLFPVGVEIRDGEIINGVFTPSV